jgi:hypothetical protein
MHDNAPFTPQSSVTEPSTNSNIQHASDRWRICHACAGARCHCPQSNIDTLNGIEHDTSIHRSFRFPLGCERLSRHNLSECIMIYRWLAPRKISSTLSCCYLITAWKERNTIASVRAMIWDLTWHSYHFSGIRQPSQRCLLPFRLCRVDLSEAIIYVDTAIRIYGEKCFSNHRSCLIHVIRKSPYLWNYWWEKDVICIQYIYSYYFTVCVKSITMPTVWSWRWNQLQWWVVCIHTCWNSLLFRPHRVLSSEKVALWGRLFPFIPRWTPSK